MDLAASRRRASELSGGVSSEPIKSLILRVLDRERAAGSLLDFGAGTGELLARLQALSRFDRLAGVDLPLLRLAPFESSAPIKLALAVAHAGRS